jgi:hypothetical protein
MLLLRPSPQLTPRRKKSILAVSMLSIQNVTISTTGWMLSSLRTNATA